MNPANPPLQTDHSKTPEEHVAEMSKEQLDVTVEAARKDRANARAAHRRWYKKSGKKKMMANNKFRKQLHKAALERKRIEDEAERQERAYAKTGQTA